MRRFIFLLAVLGIAVSCGAQTTEPAGGGELIYNKGELPAYGAETARLVNQKDEIVSILRNGMVVVVKRIPSPVVAVRGYCETGGSYEGKWLGGGLSHLLEHLVAGGSSERRTEAENRNLLQKIGNDSNAYTTTDHTCFYVNTTTAHMEDAVNLVTGWMLGAKITVPEYRREYQVVQRELERDKGQPDYVFYDLFLRNRYQVSPMRVPVIGYQEVIQGLSRDDVYSYYQLAYQPNNIIFAVVGDVDPEVMLATVRKYVSDSKPGRVFSHDVAQEPEVLSPRTLVATFPKLGQAQVDLCFPTIKNDNPDLYALDLLAALLGDGESSVLVEELRDQQQLVTDIAAGDDTPSFVTGSFEIDMKLPPENLGAATKTIMGIVNDIREKGVDPDRLARAKTLMKMQRLEGMQTSEDVAASLALDYMYSGDPHFTDRYVDRIQKVTPEQVQAVAKKYLDANRLVTTVMLPAEAVGTGGLPQAVDLIRPQQEATTQQTEEASGQEKIHRYVLSNGTVLLTRRVTTTPLVYVQAYASGGVTTEGASTNGLGNLAMNLLRRGTQTRTADQISEYFDSIGGQIGGSCGNNTWSWSMSVSKDDLPKAMEYYADIVLHPAFAGDQLAEMKERLLAAIAAQDADWHNAAIRFFKKSYYGPLNSPYQFMPIGTAENLKGFSADQVRKWYEEKVLTAPRVLTIFGDVDGEQARQMAETLLGGGDKLPPMPTLPQFTSVPAADDAVPYLNVERVEVKKVDAGGQAGVFIGFDAHGVIGDPANYTAIRAYTLAGGYAYPTGYIFETLRGLGLVYEAATYIVPGRTADMPTAMMSYAGCDPKNVNTVVDKILYNIARLQGTPADMDTDWFGRGRDLITTNHALEIETPQAQAEQAALDELMGCGYDYNDQFNDRINAVTMDDVRAYARARMRDCVVTITTSDPGAVTVTAGKREYPGAFEPVNLTPRGIQHDTGAPH